MSRLKRSLKDVIKGEKKKAPNPEGEETPCSSKDKEQPKINVVLTGPDQDTSKKGGKTKEDKKEDQAAEGKTKGGKEKGQAAGKPPCSSKDKDQPQRDEVSKGTDEGTSEDEEKTKGDAKKDEAAGPLEQTLQSLHQMQHYAGTENNNTTLTEKLKTIASDKGFRISDNQGSGNCMFHALSEQLETIKGIKIQHGQLRQSLVQYLRKNSRLPDGTDLCHFVDGHETWSNYLTYMEQDGTWGDHVILCAAANHFKTCIHVVSSLNNDVVIRPHDLVDESKPLVLGHIDNVHYVSLQPIKEETPCSSKDKKQPKINVVLTGPDQDTSEKGGKTKEDKKEDQAAEKERETKGGKEKGQAAEKPPCSSKDKDQPQRDEVSKGTDQGTSKDEEKTNRDAKKDEAADSGTVLCGSTEELKNKKEVCAAACTAVEGGTSVSENNKELNQLHSVEKEGDVTEMKSTLPRGLSIDPRNTTGTTPLMNAALNGNVQAVESMIERGADPSLTDNEGWNTLHHAASGGDTNIISLIHTHLPNIESKTGEGYTPLMVAASSGELRAVKWFLAKRATVACECNKGWNTLHFAAEGGDTEIISLIHTHLPSIESKTGEGYTPLMVAVFNGKLDAVKWFLAKGATVACEDNRCRNTLHLAAESGDTAIISLIHNHLSNIESKSGEGHTPLMVAAFTGKLDAVKWFLAKGATAACEDKRGWNTLHSAAESGDTAIIYLIHTHLPNIESKTGEGYTPLMVATINGNFHAVKWFLDKGATVACECNEGWNTLHYAAEGGDTDIISLIHTHLPSIESKTNDGYTPLMVAAFSGQLDAVKWFLEKGATVACEDKRGRSPLHHAAEGSDPDTIDLILTHLPDVESKTADGETPLIIAVIYGKLQGVKYLLERGANPLAEDNKRQNSLYHASSCDSDIFDLLLSHVR